MTDAGSGVGDVGRGRARADGMIEPEDCAAAVIEGLARESFLILPHPRCSPTCAASRTTTTAGSSACSGSRSGSASSGRRP
jgi:hypothetical protein